MPPRERPIRRKPRSKAATIRIYGTPAHQQFLRSLPCLGCARIGTDERPHHLHHVRNGGLSKKADAKYQVPLCCLCHAELHGLNGGQQTFEHTHAAMLCYRTLESWAQQFAEAWKGWTP